MVVLLLREEGEGADEFAVDAVEPPAVAVGAGAVRWRAMGASWCVVEALPHGVPSLDRTP
ncbi:hypothetical protein STTU_5951 [Streptomyces sp. Tu6071]|nr:hypothetical protein STTU_5951 [Streptomyces sp. Tu6071]